MHLCKCNSALNLPQFWWWLEISEAQEDPKSTEKVHFSLFFVFLKTWFQENFKNILKPSVTWPHLPCISVPSLLMKQLILLNWLLMEPSKVWIFGILMQKNNCDIIKWWCHIFTPQRLKGFLVWRSTNLSSLVYIQKGVPDFQKNINWHV